MLLKGLIPALVFSLLASQVWAGATVSYHGRILKPDGSPLEDSSVAFKIQVRSPGVQNCLLYEEARSLNMHASNGMFVIPIGDGNGARTASDPGITIENVFSNNTALNFTSLTCNSGNSYSPLLLDSRRLVVSFDDGTGAGVQTLASMDINYVPLALHSYEAQTALKLGSTPAANVMTVSGPASALTPSNFTELLALVNGTSTTYAKTSSSVGGDLSGTIASANVIKLQGRAVSSSAPSNNDVLTWNGTSWAPAAGGGGGAVSSVAGRTGAVTLANTDISGLGDSATKNVGTTAGTVAAGDDARFGTASTFTGSFTGDVTGTQSATVVSAVGGSTATNVHNAELLANSATSANTASTIVRRDSNGDFISRDASLRSVILRDSGSKNITMVAPATLTNSYTLTWPLDKGALNQVLTTDASGNLSWSTPAGSGVSTVTSGGAPIVIGGTASVPTVSVNAATDSTSGVVTLATDGGTAAGTVVQATDARLTNARAPSGSAGGDLGSTYPNPTVNGIKGAAITYTSLTTGDFLKYNGSAWVNTALSSANLSDTSDLLKASHMPANCSAGSTLTFSSPSGTWVCSTIAGLDAGVITTGTIADNRLPASATYWQAATGGINYGSGNVGIGTTTPAEKMDVNGNLKITGSGNGIKFPDGSVQTTAANASGSTTVQAFLTSGVWTKPSSGTVAMIECWGGGGSGAKNTAAGGGGGGAYVRGTVALSVLGATETVTIGAGGVSRTSTAAGASGGTTSFGTWISAAGGSGGLGATGTQGNGGGGIGASSAGIEAPPEAATAGGESYSVYTPTCPSFAGASGYFSGGGGGGAGAGNIGYCTATNGGNSNYGGGGGGACSNTVTSTGGIGKIYGGNGGAGSCTGNGVAGSVPGGGGGGSKSGNSGAGGAGKCVVTVW